METKFDQLVTILSTCPSSIDVFHEIMLILQQQTTASLSSFISESFQSLLTLKHWSWQLFSEDYHQWINQPYYHELFQTFASFNKRMIYHYDNIEVDTKASLLFPETIDQVNRIFQQIEQSHDDNNPYITILGLWFDNDSHFLHDNPQYSVSSVIDHMGEYIARNYVMTKPYKLYLTELQQSQLLQTIFTAKILFYIKTCSFYLYTYLGLKVHDFPYTAEEMLEYISEDYLQILGAHSRTVSLWSEELIGCIAQLIGLVCRCCWWDGDKKTPMKVLYPTEQITCDHVQDLVRIIGHKPFYKQTKSVLSNHVTILIDATCTLLLITVKAQNVSWLFRSNNTIRDAMLSASEAALNDEVCLLGYTILGETLPDEDLIDLKISDNMSGYFFNVLEEAWHHSSKKYKHVRIIDLLQCKCTDLSKFSSHFSLKLVTSSTFFLYFITGFRTLSKNDSIQHSTFRLNKISLFIEMSAEHPIAFDIIWALSFNQGIQKQLRSNATFASKLAHFAKQSDEKQMSRIIHGILWNLEINHQSRPNSDITNENSFDIMISYSHKEKTLCQQIYDELTKTGYRVWIDFDQMHGNVMDAMAQAIEQSKTVIICMSEEYRKSNYCRAEAHYAFQRQRKIVPVLLQKHYKPDGWLLFLIGQLLYVDFNKHEFSRAMAMLFKEIKVEDSSEIIVTPVQSTKNVDVPPPPITSARTSLEASTTPTFSPNILEWTQTQVQEWLIQHNLIQMSHLLTHCDGRSLVYLSKYMKNCQLQQILNLLQEDAMRRTKQTVSLIEISCFHSLMDQQKQFLQSTGRTANIEKKDA